jgi:hypothetical protein
MYKKILKKYKPEAFLICNFKLLKTKLIVTLKPTAMKSIKILLVVLLAAANHTKTIAQQPAVVLSDKEGWHKIGETTVNFKTETDEIMVIGANRFESVKIKVTDAPVYLQSFDIYFDKGDMQSVTIGEDIKSPGETRTVQLDGKGERVVRKVAFRYKTAAGNAGNRAHVELWGLKTNSAKK